MLQELLSELNLLFSHVCGCQFSSSLVGVLHHINYALKHLKHSDKHHNIECQSAILLLCNSLINKASELIYILNTTLSVFAVKIVPNKSKAAEQNHSSVSFLNDSVTLNESVE